MNELAKLLMILDKVTNLRLNNTCVWFQERSGVWMRSCCKARYYGTKAPAKCERCELPVEEVD